METAAAAWRWHAAAAKAARCGGSGGGGGGGEDDELETTARYGGVGAGICPR
ncbi:hypothetical protein [Oryza sativa Japonica Group]|uniref:Uncharacterized protein n=2 Tax=Oryza sativa subsp. japonica TaxID=39947 RepID=Q5VPZ8_ORYSJ|nr:hypothetical protein [Oryza sativa Japonica Group]BAD68917.1 hypothetical protein [Oryza sativa Japonica Group]